MKGSLTKLRKMVSALSRRHCTSAMAAALVFLAATGSQAESFTGLRFTRIGNQVIAVPTTYFLLPRYRPVRPSGPEVWQVRLSNGNARFTRSYQVNNSALAMQRARRDYRNASILAVRKR